MLINLAPLGIDWQSIPISGASPQANLAALLDLCFIATDAVDTECFQPLRSTVDVEELVGPGGDRLTLPPSGNGNAMALMQHWPITEALGGQVSPANSFPPQWQALTAAMLWAGQASNQFLGGSSLGSSGSDGMNIVEVQPGYVSWGYGRGGCRLQIAYINGWPTAGLLPAATTSATFTSGNVDATVSSTTGITEGAPISCLGLLDDGTLVASVGSGTITLSQPASNSGTGLAQVGYAVGVTSLNVDDVTGMDGTGPTIFDGALSENVRITGATAVSPVQVLPGLYATIGEGVVTLASPTRQAHSGTEPASALVSAMPANVRLATYYYAGAEAMQRGGTAFTVQALPGSLQSSGGTPSIGDLTKQAEEQLKNFRRVF